VLKNAWMDTEGLTPEQLLTMHTEELLVYTPDYRTTDEAATCDLKTMGLVGMHLVRKTMGQQAWTWSTFEHVNNAPDCDGLLPEESGGGSNPGPNTGCPETVESDYWFYPDECNDADDSCADCNTPPSSNGDCKNPDTEDDAGWCPNEAPAETDGMSKLCRQVPVTEDGEYSAAYAQNAACATELGDSVWSNYEVISTQWYTDSGINPTDCGNVVASLDKNNIAPLVTIDGGAEKPFLGNTALESYERSNCTGCHAKAKLTHTETVDTGVDTTSYYTDMSYWLEVEVPAAGHSSTTSSTK
jgi:hypothetical protein